MPTFGYGAIDQLDQMQDRDLPAYGFKAGGDL
jgi:hypothetical protein